MFCPSCGVQAEAGTKFCKACGTKLLEHARLLAKTAELRSQNPETLRRESRLISGVVLTMVTAANLFIFLTIFGAAALGRLPGGMETGFRWMLGAFLGTSLITGLAALIFLVLGGFFKTVKRHNLRYVMALAEEKRKLLEQEDEEVLLDFGAAAMPELASVTESTTRELRGRAEATRRVEARRSLDTE
jgi:hypothetical protein